MNRIDQRFTEAVERLDDATAMVPVPAAPPPRHSVAIPIVSVAAAIAVTFGVVSVLRPTDSVGPASPPPEFAQGSHGTEITMSEIDDGDGNPATITVRGEPAAGDVRITPQPGNMTAVTLPDGTQQQVAAEMCVESDAGGVCGPAELFSEPQLQVGPRGPGGQAFVTGVPSDVYAVTFTAGAIRHWAIPLHGIVAFPFPDTAAPHATVTGINLDGHVVFTQTATNDMLTDPEIERAVTTQLTGDQLADAWFVETPADAGWGPEVVRSEGRTSLTGFPGPFSAQSFFTQPDSAAAEESVTVLTVRSDDVDAVLQRLDTLDTGRVHTTTPVDEAATVIVWAGNNVPDNLLDDVVETLAPRQPHADLAIDITTPRAWNSMERSPAHVPAGTPVDALLTDAAPTDSNVTIRAQGDDVGTIRYFLALDNTNVSSVDVGGPVPSPLMNLDDLVGLELQPMLLTIPADITNVTFITDTEEVDTAIVHLAETATVALLAITPAQPGATIRDVNITP